MASFDREQRLDYNTTACSDETKRKTSGLIADI